MKKKTVLLKTKFAGRSRGFTRRRSIYQFIAHDSPRTTNGGVQLCFFFLKNACFNVSRDFLFKTRRNKKPPGVVLILINDVGVTAFGVYLFRLMKTFRPDVSKTKQKKTTYASTSTKTAVFEFSNTVFGVGNSLGRFCSYAFYIELIISMTSVRFILCLTRLFWRRK